MLCLKEQGHLHSGPRPEQQKTRAEKTAGVIYCSGGSASTFQVSLVNIKVSALFLPRTR